MNMCFADILMNVQSPLGRRLMLYLVLAFGQIDATQVNVFFDNIFFCIVSHSVMPLSTRRTLLIQFSCFPLNLGRWTLTMNIAPTTMS
jgi:hypothetical protein